MVGGLEQLHVVVVDARQHRRARVAAHQAAVRVAEVEVRLGRVDGRAERRARAHGPRALTPRLGQRGHPAVRGVDDERRAPGADRARPPVEPEDVVRAGLPLQARVVRRVEPAAGTLAGGGNGDRPLRRPLLHRPDPRALVLLDLGRLFRGQELAVAVAFRALERGARLVLPDAPEVRLAPGRARRRRRLRLGRSGHRNRQRGDGNHASHAKGQIPHLDSPPWAERHFIGRSTLRTPRNRDRPTRIPPNAVDADVRSPPHGHARHLSGAEAATARGGVRLPVDHQAPHRLSGAEAATGRGGESHPRRARGPERPRHRPRPSPDDFALEKPSY